jgi:hypothetical protein
MHDHTQACVRGPILAPTVGGKLCPGRASWIIRMGGMRTVSDLRMGIVFPLGDTLAALDVWSGPSSLRSGWLSPCCCAFNFRASSGNECPWWDTDSRCATEPGGASMQCANPKCSKELFYLREGRLELLELESDSDDQLRPDDGAFAMKSLPSNFWGFVASARKCTS